MGHINLLMDENTPKSYSIDRMKFSNNSVKVVKMTKIIEI
jgi:hypothetical protein